MTADKIRAIAAAEIGTTEYPPKSNNVKYNTAYYGREVYGDDAYPWCMVFVWWVFREAGASKLFYDGYGTASCPTLAKWAQKNGQWVTDDYKPGDVLIYDFDKSDEWPYEHTGILDYINGSTYFVIEGNTSLTDDDNGGAVMRRIRYKSQIAGAFRPKYEKEDDIDMTKDEVIKIVNDAVADVIGTRAEFQSYVAEIVKDAVRDAIPQEDVYHTLDDVPDYWRDDIAKLVADCVIRGEADDDLGLTRSEAKNAVIAKRIVDAGNI